MRNIILSSIWILLGLSAISDNPAIAQRKNVSSKEVNGTFTTADRLKTIKILSVGKGGVDSPLETLRERPGYNLQVKISIWSEPFPKGDYPGQGELNGYAKIVGDLATFIPDGIDANKCTINMKFKRSGILVIDQKGSCIFVNGDSLKTGGTYQKRSSSKPIFQD